MNLAQALNSALDTALDADDRVILLGEDIGRTGGVFRITDGLLEKYGEDRVFDTPVAESGIVGAAFGMAVAGMLPVAELQFLGFSYPAYDQVINHVARIRNRSAHRFTAPMVIRIPYGGGIGAAEHHSESTEAIGPARVERKGEDITLISWGAMMKETRAAATALEEQGVSVEVLDLRTLSPLDNASIVSSAEKTGRVVVVHEAPRTGGLGGEIAAVIQEQALYSLLGPVRRVTGWDTVFPLKRSEGHYLPTVERILQAAEQTLEN